MGVSTRCRVFIGMLLATLVAAAPWTPVRAQDSAANYSRFAIAAQDAADALNAFSAQSRLQLLFDYDAVQGIRTRAVSGTLPVAAALGQMLSGTGLKFEVVNERTISIVRDAAFAADDASAARATAPPANRNDATRAARGANEASPASDNTRGIDEIIVTAEKRDQSLQRSALAVTALSSRVVERQQITDLKSVTTLIPNLQIGLSSTQAAVDLALRGIVSTNRTEIGDAAVAFHVDGFYSPRPQGATMLIHDLDRLEALRGPQGTLFGRNANAGVINVVTAKPELGETFGAIDVTLGQLRAAAHQGPPEHSAGRNLCLARRRVRRTARRIHPFPARFECHRIDAAVRRQRQSCVPSLGSMGAR